HRRRLRHARRDRARLAARHRRRGDALRASQRRSRITLQPPCTHHVGGGMRRILGIAVVLVAFAAPAGTAMAKTSKADKQEAKQECRAERGTTDATREAFKAK